MKKININKRMEHTMGNTGTNLKEPPMAKAGTISAAK